VAKPSMLRFALIPENETFLDLEIDAIYGALWGLNDDVRRRLKLDQAFGELAADVCRRMWLRDEPIRSLHYVTDDDLKKIDNARDHIPILMCVEISKEFLKEAFSYWDIVRRQHYNFMQLTSSVTSLVDSWNAKSSMPEKVPEEFLRKIRQRINGVGSRLKGAPFDSKAKKRVALHVNIIADYRSDEL
jgi:hypothetical protein